MRTRWMVLFAVFALVGGALACSTPVFRYAIERWEADPYRLMVFTDGGEMDAEQQEALKAFEVYERFGFRTPPLLIEQIDISSTTAPPSSVWTELSAHRSAPCIAMLYPKVMRLETTVWDDELTMKALNQIVMSPARLETANRLLGGDAAVWLLIRGDDLEETRSVREMLDKKLKEIEEATVFNDDFLQKVEDEGLEMPELRFSVLEVDRDDPREAFFMAMLTRLAPESSEHTGPIVIPVFGQGRAAVMMMGEFIDGQYIERVAEFLTGECSCEVKDLNPGFDLLIPIDWIDGITEEYVFDAELPPLTSPSAAFEPTQEPEIDLLEKPIEEEKSSETGLFVGVLGVFGMVVLGILGLLSWVLVRKKQSS